MSFKINDNVTWVGKIDWELSSFHGDEYSIHRGTHYNSYLVRDEKTVLIDTVWDPFDKEFVENLKKEIDLKKIDMIIANHAEIDHSGSLPLLLKEIPDVPVYCTANGMKNLKGHFHEDWNFVTVKTGDSIDIGERKLIFVEARMLHWPDSMMTYMTKDNILFSNDAFGQHFASDLMYNDLVNQCELFEEAIKYYANILTPFSALVTNKIRELLSFNLPVDMICPSHGIIWRDNPKQIIEKYMEWADKYKENQITLVYDSMWKSTRKMAEAIAEGIKSVDSDVAVKLYSASHADKNDILTELFRSKAFMVGSSTINKNVLFAISGMLDMVKGIGFKDKKTAAFGSYGWSGEHIGVIEQRLKEAGLEVVQPGIRELWNPDEDGLARCREFGKSFAEKL